jgi:hypothetical protein
MKRSVVVIRKRSTRERIGKEITIPPHMTAEQVAASIQSTLASGFIALVERN